MTIEQTVEIPPNRRLFVDVPPEVPIGSAHLIIKFPIQEDEQNCNTVMPEAKGRISNEAFRNALHRAYGAWKDNPWTNHLKDVNAIRDEWEHRE